MRRRNEGILNLLSQAPWWVGVSFAVVVFVALRFVVPAVASQNPLGRGVAALARQMCWFAAVFLLPAAFSALNSGRKRAQLDRQSGIESIRALSWKQFEELLAEAYRRLGYTVRENTSAAPDGGVDITLERGGSRYLVQCKQWRSVKVGVNVAREMLGLVTAERAAGAIIVTSGMFTQEARNFAAGRPIDLVDGDVLVDLIRNVQARPVTAPAPPASSAPLVEARCPSCGRPLVLREARRGPRAGSKFWGCAGFPKCQYTRNYEKQQPMPPASGGGS